MPLPLSRVDHCILARVATCHLVESGAIYIHPEQLLTAHNMFGASICSSIRSSVRYSAVRHQRILCKSERRFLGQLIFYDSNIQTESLILDRPTICGQHDVQVLLVVLGFAVPNGMLEANAKPAQFPS